METIASRIKQALEIRGMKQADLVEQTGIGKSSISTYLSGAYEPKQRNIYKIAKALNVNEAWLMGQDVPMNRLDNNQIPKNAIPIPSSHLIPVIGTIACGMPVLAQENIEDYEPCPDYVSADFALHCKGDSMINARINDGDTVFIRKQPEVENGEIAAVEILDGEGYDECCEATLKRFYHNGNNVTLVAENPSYSPMTFSGEQLNNVKVIGKAVYFLSTIK